MDAGCGDCFAAGVDPSYYMCSPAYSNGSWPAGVQLKACASVVDADEWEVHDLRYLVCVFSPIFCSMPWFGGWKQELCGKTIFTCCVPWVISSAQNFRRLTEASRISSYGHYHHSRGELVPNCFLAIFDDCRYPSFFENRLGDGLHLSFIFIQSGAANSVQGASPANPIASRPTEHKSPAAFAKAGISRIYKLIRGSRNSRSKFMSSIIRKFDFGQSGVQAISFLLWVSMCRCLCWMVIVIPDVILSADLCGSMLRSVLEGYKWRRFVSKDDKHACKS